MTPYERRQSPLDTLHEQPGARVSGSTLANDSNTPGLEGLSLGIYGETILHQQNPSPSNLLIKRHQQDAAVLITAGVSIPWDVGSTSYSYAQVSSG